MDAPRDAIAPSTSAFEVDTRLLAIAHRVLVTTPGYVQMRSHPEFHDWAADLVRFGERDDLRPLAGALEHIASSISTGEDSIEPLLEVLRQDSSKIDLRTLILASSVSEESTTDRPYVSFMLAWATLCIWILGAPTRGEHLYGEKEPWPRWPHPGWASIPAACAGAAIKLEGLYGGQLLAAEAYAVLQANWRRYLGDRGALEPVIARYRRLAQSIASRYDRAIASLSEEFREACRNGSRRARSFVAALLWSFGLIPECKAFQENPEMPSRRLLRRLIQTSIQVVPDDPLIQYLWLEIKDDTCVNLRTHEALLAVFNHRWDQWWIDDEYPALGLSAGPSRLYARTLEALLAGDLDQTGAAEYLHAYDLISDGHLSSPSEAFVLHRMSMLRHLIGVRFDYYGPEFTEDEHVKYLKELTEASGRRRERATWYPEWPNILSRTSHSVFELIERCLAEHTQLGRSEPERCMLVLETLEGHRTAALTYWMQVNRTLLMVAEDEELKALLLEERNLIERLRGAYFLALRPILPMHFWWSDMDFADRIDLDDPARREWFYSPDVARKEMEEVERALKQVAERLRAHAPNRAALGQIPSAALERIVAILSHHTRPLTTVRASAG